MGERRLEEAVRTNRQGVGRELILDSTYVIQWSQSADPGDTLSCTVRM